MSAQILVVDDDPKVREIVSESLGRGGFRVATVATGGEALEYADDNRPELIILDIGLPDMTGLEVLEHVRSGAGHETPVLVLSGETNLDKRRVALKGGADDFLVKPLLLSELRLKVEGALRRGHRVHVLGTRNRELEAAIVESVEQSRREFKKHLLSTRTLLAMSQDLNRALETDQLVKVASLTLVGELKASSMALFSVERDTDARFRLLGVKGFENKRFDGLTIDRSSTFVAMLEKEMHTQRIARNPDQRWVKSLPDLRLAVFEYATPITVREEMKGILFTGPKMSGDPYTDYELDIMAFIANSVGIGIENAHLVTQLQTTYVSTLRSLISIIEAKDAYTKGHTERVAAYAVALAQRLGLPPDDVRRITFGALLHDIGKMGVLDGIINKPGALTEEEWELMRAHPVTGAQIVEKMEFLGGSVEIVRHHHESWNGRGYPDGLRGEDIPLGARIVTVADSFDAMTTDRPYRKALGLDEAVTRLEEASGTQFDARLVKAFVRCLRERGTALSVRAARDETPDV